MSKSAKRPPQYQGPERRLYPPPPPSGSRGAFTLISVVLLIIATFMWSCELMAANQAFLVEEREGNGRVKQCVYDYLGDEYVITIPSYEVCQPVIDVSDR